MHPFTHLSDSFRTIVCLLILCPALCKSQTISAVSFPSSTQLGIADTIRINTTAETPNSGASFDSYSLNYDTIIINLKHCISYLDFYGVVTIKTKIPPKPAGKYKVKINLMTFNAVWNPSCNIEYERHIWYDSIEVNAKYTSLNSIQNNDQIKNIYPNPVKDKFKINQSNYLPLKRLQVKNMIGQAVYETVEVPSEIDISFLTPGIYFLNISDIENRQSTIKIFKE
ncbi:MAG: T9SS type A sorting domain-containing protein [Bacteroidia bacterium]|nr:T9SS type A sorting domain-containing protein [Bacteroidia bacterium]